MIIPPPTLDWTVYLWAIPILLVLFLALVGLLFIVLAIYGLVQARRIDRKIKIINNLPPVSRLN